MHWFQATRTACENGYKTLHLGGGLGAALDNLYSFKKAFNRGSDCDFYLGKKIFCKEVYEDFVNYRRKEVSFDKESSFFPLYRA